MEAPMGLDMYLTAEKYLGQYDDTQKTKAAKVAQVFPEIGDLRVKSVEVELMYWRKANQIHSWFVQNLQDGEDKCQRSYCPAEKLQELVGLCKKILKAKGEKRIELANTLLSPQGGFFFGSTDIDEYYFEDLQRTVDQLDKVLAMDLSDWGFYYQASW
jgi:hypothetical protein